MLMHKNFEFEFRLNKTKMIPYIIFYIVKILIFTMDIDKEFNLILIF